jgi:3-phenylpropionate/trans-cinnamate dioxygenase ferredoxin subunit
VDAKRVEREDGRTRARRTAMSDFVYLTDIGDLPDGAMKQADADGHEFLVAHVGGAYLVSDARCPHLHGHLAKGTLEGTIVTCPLHHSQFDLADGAVVRWTDFTGAVRSVAEFARHPRPLRVYDVRVDGTELSVGAQKTPPA